MAYIVYSRRRSKPLYLKYKIFFRSHNDGYSEDMMMVDESFQKARQLIS